MTSLFMASPLYGGQPSPEEIVRLADEVRSPALDYTVMARVTSVRPGGKRRVVEYQVMAKGREKTLVKTLYPRSQRGRMLLMRGRNLWAFMPNLSRPVRISLSQRLMGEVANGDIARVNFSGDYKPRLLRVEEIGGRSYYVLELKAKAPDVTYHRVIYWVEKGSFHPFKAEFYAASGRLLKRCSYQAYRKLGGRLRPTRLVLEDPLVKGRYSIIEYDRMVIRRLPDKYFTKEYLKRLRY